MFSAVGSSSRSRQVASPSTQRELLSLMSAMQNAVHVLGSHLACGATLKGVVSIPDVFKSSKDSEDTWVDDTSDFSGLQDLMTKINNQQIPNPKNQLAIIKALHQLIDTCQNFDMAGPSYMIVMSELKCPEVFNHARTQLIQLIQAGQFDSSNEAITILINLALHSDAEVRRVANRQLVNLILAGKFNDRCVELLALATADSAEIVEPVTQHAANRMLQKLIPTGKFNQDNIAFLLTLIAPGNFQEQTRQVAMQYLSTLIHSGALDRSVGSLRRIATISDNELSSELKQTAINRLIYLLQQTRK